MTRRANTGLLVFLFVAAAGLASCGRREEKPEAGKPAAAAEIPGPAADVAPFVSLDSYRKQDLQPGTQLHAWNLRAYGLKQLTASLMVFRDGKAQTASKIEYKWDKWDKSQPPASGQILLLIQDGQPFGVKDKRLPLLAVDFPKLPDHARSALTSNVVIDGGLQSRMATASNQGTVANNVLYAELFAPAKDLGSVSLSSDVKSMIKLAQSGRTVLAVTMAWVPRDN